MKVLLLIFALVLLLPYHECNPRKKKPKQDIKFRGGGRQPTSVDTSITGSESISATEAMARTLSSGSAAASSYASSSSSISSSSGSTPTTAKSSTTQGDDHSLIMSTGNNFGDGAKKPASTDDNFISNVICPAGPKDFISHAVLRFWRGELIDAYVCALAALQLRKDHGLMKSMLYYLSQSRNSISSLVPKFDAPTIEASTLLQWEILGPFPVSKLEVDGDPAFDVVDDNAPLWSRDPAVQILSMNSSIKLYSELVSGATVSWASVNAKIGSGQVDIRVPVQWNELGQALSNSAVFEFQAWARITTYAYANGQYMLQCVGPHTVYVRNENITRILTGDVYQSGRVVNYVELRIGPVGIAIPIRGVGQSSFSCSLQYVKEPGLVVIGTMQVPDLLELEPYSSAKLYRVSPGLACLAGAGATLFSPPSVKTTSGLMISNVFSVLLQNSGLHPFTVDIQVHKASRSVVATGAKIGIRQAIPLYRTESMKSNFPTGGDGTVVVAPGQILNLPLEIYSDDDDSPHITLPCKKGSAVIEFFVVPSRGASVKANVEFACRRHNQSIVYSYLDHDKSVSQAAFVFPLPENPESLLAQRASYIQQAILKAKVASSAASDAGSVDGTSPHGLSVSLAAIAESIVLDINGTKVQGSFETLDKVVAPLDQIDDTNSSNLVLSEFPYLLTLHGTGLSASSQADAYKMMPQKSSEYVFGVEGMWVIAPTRHGAHNWEAVGSLSALLAVQSLRLLMARYPKLPQVSRAPGLVAGHSMGGHGAWQVSVSHPNLAYCVVAAASWVRKEDYGKANAYFDLDIQNTVVDPDLKGILERNLAEFHVDRLASNLQNADVHIRVGSQDMTTHPWFSRRMHRVLKRHGINSSLEEVAGKQHWWWDTNAANDGGALNDPTLRSIYSHCLQRYQREIGRQWKTCSARHTELKKSQSSAKIEDQPVDGKLDMTTDDYVTSLIDHGPHRCGGSPFTHSIINIGASSGKCGLQIISQHRYQSLSTVGVDCREHSLESYHHLFGDASNVVSTSSTLYRCVLNTTNVRRLRIARVVLNGMKADHRHQELFGHFLSRQLAYRAHETSSLPKWSTEILVDGQRIDLPHELVGIDDKQIQIMDYVDLCWLDKTSTPTICINQVVNPEEERTMHNTGPIRQVYSKPFYIIYGTPQNQALRHAMRDLAVYLANSHLAAHSTQVRVLSDLDYRAGGYAKEPELANLLVIGGPTLNKFMKKMCKCITVVGLNASSGSASRSASKDLKDDSKASDLQCWSPAIFELESTADLSDAHIQQFKIGPFAFNDPQDGAIFTFPISRQSQRKKVNINRITYEVISDDGTTSNFGRPSQSYLEGDENKFDQGIGACLHATTPEGFMQLTRIAWPVIPPMVRAPFANYIPDYMVINSRVWRDGFGAVQLAGYWNATWGFDESNFFAAR